jgi:hypothetical protein
MVLTAALIAQSVPSALESPAAQPPQLGPHGEKLPGMPKFHDPAPYNMNEHTGYKQIFDSKSFAGWDADPNIWRVEGGMIVGETLEGKPKGNNYIVYRGDKTRDFDLKLQMKIEKGGGGGIQYRSVTGVPWTRPQPAGQPPYDLKFMMTGPQADFWFPVSAAAASYTGFARPDQSSHRKYRRHPGLRRLCEGKRVERLRNHCARGCNDAHHERPTDGHIHR